VSVFIEIALDENRISPELGRQLVSICPVNIFEQNGTRLHVIRENQDECTLCELCLKLAPRGTLAIRKLYKDETLQARGTEPE